MLTGAALGAAISEALEKAGISKAEIARRFNVKPPSVSGWIKTGRISKSNFEKLRRMLADVVPDHHWGFHSAANNRHSLAQPRAGYHLNHESDDLSDDEAYLVEAFRKAGKQTRTALHEFAKAIHAAHPRLQKKRASHN
jgi:predicted XRE-type DNA-binding protein